jgi:hypothetical protein
VYTETDHLTDAEVSSQVELPRIECLDVLRQMGHVAVVKDANVEVHEYSRKGVAPCEPSELSSQLRLNIDRPIILSYKYLNVQNSVILTVKEHLAMETLEATIDRVHYEAVITDAHDTLAHAYFAKY